MRDTALVFDLGKVLVDYDYRRVLEFVFERGAQVVDPEEFARRTDFSLYESGRMTDREFYERVVDLVREPFEYDEWVRVWTSIFTPMPDMLDLFDRLRSVYSSHILSNISPLHFDYLDRSVGLVGRCASALTSCEAGVMKPDAKIYAIAERRFGLEPGRIVFIDDREENVVAARRAGWRAIRHVSRAETVTALNELGVRLESGD